MWRSAHRRYYSKSNAFFAGVGITFLFVTMTAGLASPYVEIRIFVAATLITMGVIGIRLFRSGIEVVDQGIRVCNVFSTFELSWQEIDGFEIGKWGVCLIHLRDGGRKHAIGIEERTNFPSGSAERIAEELNAELAKARSGSL